MKIDFTIEKEERKLEVGDVITSQNGAWLVINMAGWSDDDYALLDLTNNSITSMTDKLSSSDWLEEGDTLIKSDHVIITRRIKE